MVPEDSARLIHGVGENIHHRYPTAAHQQDHPGAESMGKQDQKISDWPRDSKYEPISTDRDSGTVSNDGQASRSRMESVRCSREAVVVCNDGSAWCLVEKMRRPLPLKLPAKPDEYDKVELPPVPGTPARNGESGETTSDE